MADVRYSADGRGLGYGTMVRRIDRVLRLGQAIGASVLFVRPAKSINRAVFHLRSDDVEIVPPGGWSAWWLTCIWFASAPFRIGSPWLWVQRVLARVLVVRVHDASERSRYLPRAVRRFIARPRPFYQRLRAANAAYGSRSSARWRLLFKHQATRRLRDAERKGREVPLRLALPANRERDAIEQASALGISTAKPLVTVHVRESGYRPAAGLRQRRWDVVRNARIETYADAFTALVERGYTVVRIGDRTMTPVNQPGVVDLATSPARTDWLEVWCMLRSEFFVGCHSGPTELAVLLGLPLLTVNAVHFGDVAGPSDRFICKLPRDKATGTVLSLSDMLTEGYLRTGLETGKYDYLDNTPGDICQAVLDMIDVVHARESLSSAQRRFNERLAELGRESAAAWSGLEGIGFMSRPRGGVSRSFADRYFT